MNEWLNKDLKYNWHPYTQMSRLEDDPPLFIEKADGIKLYDDDGNWYYDTIASWWCNVHGHGHPRIRNAVQEQMERLDHVLFAAVAHRPASELAERLVSITPEKLRRVFYSDDGSTAVEVALKMSVKYWRNQGREAKRSFVCLRPGYHGDTVGGMSVSGVTLFRQSFAPLLFDSTSVPGPYCYRCPLGLDRDSCDLACLQAMEESVRENADRTAGIILEPLLMAAGGMIVYPEEYLQGVARIAQRYGLHLIVDEVATGFGRTGQMFACDRAGVNPDFMCLSKGITGGTMPLAATLTTRDVYEAFLGEPGGDRTFYHGHTYTANPVGCAAALSSLELIGQNDLLSHVRNLSPVLHDGMQQLRTLPRVGDCRHIGFMAALELVKDDDSRDPYPSWHPLLRKIYQNGLRHNIMLRPLGNIIYLFPPLCTNRRQLEDILHRTADTLRESL
ncbi:MAG: adenosylmethionine--8-amino-7-oxononanoate transaminase, partial [Candidatus Brocadiia bacterium]